MRQHSKFKCIPTVWLKSSKFHFGGKVTGTQVGCWLQWRLVIALFEVMCVDRHRPQRDTSITCLLAVLCTPRLSRGIIYGCPEIITCCHSRAPAGEAGTLLWIRADRWKKRTSGLKGHRCLDFRKKKKNIWLCQLNDEPRAYKRDIGFSERHLDALGESIAAPGVGDLSWLAEPMKLQVQIPTGQEWAMSWKHTSERRCIAVYLSKLIRPTSLWFVGAQSSWHNRGTICFIGVLSEDPRSLQFQEIEFRFSETNCSEKLRNGNGRRWNSINIKGAIHPFSIAAHLAQCWNSSRCLGVKEEIELGQVTSFEPYTH